MLDLVQHSQGDLLFQYDTLYHPPLKMYFRGERSGKKNTFTVLQEFDSPGPPLNTLFDRWVYVKCRIHGSGYPTPPGSFILGGWFNTFYGFGFSRIPGNV